MGLHTTHDCWHGSYSAFAEWRNCIAELAGYRLKQVDICDGTVTCNVDIDWEHITDANVLGQWEFTPVDPLLVLLVHSDCEGFIYSEQTTPLADALEALLPAIPDGEEGYPTDFWRNRTTGFVDGLRKAAITGEPVGFL